MNDIRRKCMKTNANPHDADSKAVADALQKQRVAEQAAAYEAKLKAPEILCYEYKYE